MNDTINPYLPKKPIVWTHEAQQGFYRIRDLIQSMPTLFFLTEEEDNVVADATSRLCEHLSCLYICQDKDNLPKEYLAILNGENQ